MLFPESVFGPEDIANMGRACDEAWQEFRDKNTSELFNGGHVVRKLMALRILEAAHTGEHDPVRLKEIALRAVEGNSTR